LATDWQHQNRKRPDTANNANASKSGLTCGFVKFQSCQIIVRWLSGGGSAGSNPAGGAIRIWRERVGDLAEAVAEQVSVNVHRHRSARIAEHLLQDFDVRAAGNGEVATPRQRQ
jgi:hypothetical protein